MVWLSKVLIALCLICIAYSKYIFLFEQCRHGARSVSHLYKEDKDFIGTVWQGESELTGVGLRQQYLLGAMIRNKYPDLLSPEYNHKEIIVYATDSNRTIMSGYAQLQGLYQKTTSEHNQLKEEQLPYALPPFDIFTDERIVSHINSLGKNPLPNAIQSTPIHIVEPRQRLFQFDKNDNCPSIDDIEDTNKQKAVIQAFLIKFNATYGERLLKIFNLKDKDTFSKMKKVNELSNSVLFGYTDGRDMTQFAEGGIDFDEFYKECLHFQVLDSTEGQVNDAGNILGLVSSSVLMRHVIEHIDRRIKADITKENEEDVPKFFLLSAHDGTVVALEDFLRIVFDKPVQFPVFASNQLFEITRDDNVVGQSFNDYTINILFNSQSKMTMNYNQFRYKVLDKAWTLEETGIYCGFIKDTKKPWRITSYFLIGITFILIIALIIMFILLRRTHRPHVLSEPLVK